MKKYFSLVCLLALSVVLFSCSHDEEDEATENYASFITPKKPDIVPLDPGVPISCFPKKIGELGFDYKPDAPKPEFRDNYTVTLHVEATAGAYGPFDKQNLSKLIIQYLDENNKLVVDTLLRGNNVVEKRAWGYVSFLSDWDDIEIKKKSGDPVYFAVFSSPYGHFELNVEMSTESEDGTASIPSLTYDYNREMESFHIETVGQEYIINSKAMYLP